MRLLYNLSIYLFQFLINVVSIFNPKASKWVKGRKNWKIQLKEKVKNENDLFWFHCSSLGEFEQGRPIIEELERKGKKVLLTFFSPSGFENQKHFSAAFHVAYLPADTSANAKAFLDIVRPNAAFFVKYEFWFNYMKALKTKGIPLLIISGIFRQNQYFFKSYGKWFANQLKEYVQHYFVQNDGSKKLLETIGISQITVSGDTRFDRVAGIVANPMVLENIEYFNNKSMVFIGGSTWLEDEKIIKHAFLKFKEINFIIVPHEVNKNRLKEINTLFNNEGLLLSDLNKEVKDCRLLIVDSIGKLSSLYQYGHFAFIGGGFGKGIHNTLEAAAFGLPLAFGPNYSKFQEASDLVKINGATVVNNPIDLINSLEHAINDKNEPGAGQKNRDYVVQNQGATSIIMNELTQSDLV